MVAIKEIRKSMNMTQAELAVLCNTTPATICRYETGERVPDLETAAKIADALHCKLDDLIKED